MWREARSERSERRRNDDFTGVKRYSIPMGIRVKVEVANAKQFGQQFVITIWWRSASVKASSTPVPVEQVVVTVPVEQVVARPEEGVVNPPRSFESVGRPVPSLRACRVDLAPVTVPVSLSAGPGVCNSQISVPTTSATSWSATTREVLDTMLVRPSTKKQYAI